MAKGRERADDYHQQFAERIINALKAGTVPWQKPSKPGERICRTISAAGATNAGATPCL